MKKSSLTFAIVEDNVDLCLLWGKIFSNRGHQVRCYYSASAALNDMDRIAQANVIVADYRLPDMNGIELVAKLRARQPNLPAVVLTAVREPSLSEDVRRLRQAVLVQKPVDIEALETAVYDLLNTTEMPRA